MSRQTRATTVVSHPPTLSIPPPFARLSRSQDSCTASSASATEPSIRYATAVKRSRWRSNCSASQSLSLIGSHPRVGSRQRGDERTAVGVTAREGRRMRLAYSQDLAIGVRGLRKTYDGGVEAVKGIDFDVAPGEVFGLLGPNGAGKSTTVGMLTTTVVPTSGEARVAGFDVAADALAARRASSVVFQEAVVDRGLTGAANIELHARLWGAPMDDAPRFVEALGLSQIIDRPVGTYSGG